ncbi:unnamed protein product [Kluyveromyces dobzhanskii CBS 2104]|uniref:WGS project CCBQ000000000 data, contig 00102 n=1 Tax=Kluyveromyces dobzhanskii CBS 2104 TaxID=1427455 RepID=A0A0A8L4M5_9SACH|nr:unnamed protein product [Kluyveromyces dobzhanskii CBS 2104]
MTTDLRTVDITTVTSVSEDPDSLIVKAFHSETWSTEDVFQQRLRPVDRPLLFQVCMIENISRSKLAQVDELQVVIDPRRQKVDRISTSRDRQQLISEVNVEDDGDEQNGVANTDSSYTNNKDAGNLNQHVYRLILQDRNGNLFYAINLDSIPALKTCFLGSKLILLPGSRFNRGMFTFTNSTVKLMYGLIQQWNDGKLQKVTDYLQHELKAQNPTLNANGKRTS